jgi:hypothetical protein
MTQLRRTAFTLGCILALAGCQSMNAPAPVTAGTPPAKPLPYGRAAEVQIEAVKPWQSAGVTLAAAESYRITASGRWSVGAMCGHTDADSRGNNPFCTTDSDNLGFPAGSLIGRVGTAGAPFLVGSNKILTPATDGELFLRSYDWLPEDNFGALTIRVSHNDSAAGGEPPPAHRDPL